MDNPQAKLWVQNFEDLSKKDKARFVRWLRAQAEFFENDEGDRECPISVGYVARLWPIRRRQ
jgi:hypothetical protein